MGNWNLDPKDLTIGAIAIAVLVAGAKEVWVWGYQYRRAVTRADYLEQLVYRLLGVTEKVIDAARDSKQQPPPPGI